MKNRIRLCVAACFCLTAVFSAGTVMAGADDNDLDIFKPALLSTETATNDVLSISYPGRIQSIEINYKALLKVGSTSKGRLKFFNEKFDVRIERTALDVSFDGTLVWSGKPVDGTGTILFSFADNIGYGRIELGGRVFLIEPVEGTRYHWIFEPNPNFQVAFDMGGIAHKSVSYESAGPAPVPAAERTVVDLLLLYTKGFAKKYSGAKLNTKINLLVGFVNIALRNSQIDMTVRLVGTKKIVFTDEGHLGVPLDAMSYGEGTASDVKAFKDVAALRDKLGADQVSLLRVFNSTNGFCGLAFLMDKFTPSFEDAAFSVVQVGAAFRSFCDDHALAHELAHNWGSNHNKGNKGIYPFSLGHRFGKYMTVMSYQSKAQEKTISHFSNPDVKYLNYKTGKKTLNNARSIGLTKSIAAKWRPTKVALDTKSPVNKTPRNFINNGAASTSKTQVKLKLKGRDNVGISAYHASESGDEPSINDPGWVYITPTKKYGKTVKHDLSPGLGVKNVYVWFKDAMENISRSKTDSIERK